jgi:hypothetical protein
VTDPGSTYRLIDLPGHGPEGVVVDGSGFVLTGLRAAAVLVMLGRQLDATWPKWDNRSLFYRAVAIRDHVPSHVKPVQCTNLPHHVD